MAKSISRELREWAGLLETSAYTKVTSEKISAIADRIDAEMVELPKGKDGEPIHVEDTIYGEDGRAWHVRGVTIGEKSPAHPGHVIRATSDANEWRHLKPEWLSHECPDGPRYKAIGNSMAVNVMRWIGERIQMVDEEQQ